MQGLILLNKPTGITSFSAVSKIKWLAHEKRVGHTGTLDPLASGVLPVLLGRATALAGIMLEKDKRYIAGVKLGVTTDTDDITGKIIDEKRTEITNDQLKAALLNFTGKIMQRPPIYSALKKDGVRLYALAREGKTVEVPEREVEIFSLKLLSPIDNDGNFKIDVHVSKGTYIRSLARDIGEYLGCGACLSSLERTLTGGISLEDCVSLDNLDPENIGEYVVSEEKIVESLRVVQVTEAQAKRFTNGGQLDFQRLKTSFTEENELVRVKFGEVFLGIGRADLAKNQLAVKCVINYP